jgi:hypothetical protein
MERKLAELRTDIMKPNNFMVILNMHLRNKSSLDTVEQV